MCGHHAGLDQEQLERIARGGLAVQKVSRRDLPGVVARGADGATTVSATMLLAHRAGIHVFVTGGIGGVHRCAGATEHAPGARPISGSADACAQQKQRRTRPAACLRPTTHAALRLESAVPRCATSRRGGELTWDVSADLTELGRTPVAVVCAGAKSVSACRTRAPPPERLGLSLPPAAAYGRCRRRLTSGWRRGSCTGGPHAQVLDIPRTLEYLETQGVAVVTLGAQEFPAFFTPHSGCKSPATADTPKQ